MARHDLDHDEERGHYGDWRDDDPRQHRGTSRGRESGDPREQHLSRFDDSYSQARERGGGYREQERGYRDRHVPEAGDRRRSHAWDWDADYSRTVDGSPRQFQVRDAGHNDRGWTGHGRQDSWSAAGPFSGRGPRGYRRSDERIMEDICEALTRHGRIDASDMDVDVDEGVVTLRGTVDGRYTKRLAEDVVDDVPGVRDVRNELRIHGWDRDRESHTYGSDVPSYESRASDDDRERYVRESDSERRSSISSGDETGPSGGEGRFISSSGSEYRDRIRESMEVVGSDGESIGDVKEVSNNSFLVDRPMKRDMFIPFGAIQSMSGYRITLSVRADEVDDQGWATPDLMGSSTGESEAR